MVPRGSPGLTEGNPQNQGGGVVPGQTRQETAAALANDCAVRAMLDAIAWAEGTASDADGGYGCLKHFLYGVHKMEG